MSRFLPRARPLPVLALAALAGGLCAAPALANEGQWQPAQIHALDADELKKLGLELSAEELWNENGNETDGGLMRAAVNLSGCSAAFVSPEGLIATNHHCAFSALQAQSVELDRDLLGEGFLAKSRDEELEAIGKTIRVLRAVKDVTQVIELAAVEAPNPSERSKRQDTKADEIVAACEAADPAHRCSVVPFFEGAVWELHIYVELKDVRLVYSPPKAVGEYGGEIDNWMWPRHTGDFSLLRAYVSPEGKPTEFAKTNVPYEPAQFLRVAPEGVRPGDFVAVLGYPGHTDRYLSAAEVQRHIDQNLPTRVEIYGEWIEILEKAGAADEKIANKVASRKKRLANVHKNSRGKLAGLDHMKLAKRRADEDARLGEWTKDNPGFDDVLEGLGAISERRRASYRRDFLLSNAGRASELLALGIELVRRAEQIQKPDEERTRRYKERNAVRVKKSVERALRDYDASVEEPMLVSLLTHGTALEGAKIDAFGGVADPAAAAASLVKDSKLSDPETVWALFEGDPKALAKSKDPAIVMARALAKQLDTLDSADAEIDGQMASLGPKYFEMLRKNREGSVYPDANGTLRFSYASVQAYDKWDGEKQEPQTTLAQAVKKHTGKEPFDLPKKVRDAAPEAPKSRWADPNLGDVPLCFLSNADTTGGNSGSPVVDGKGRFVGLNFDRVWENIAGDYGYHQGHSRNITVDVRYLLWILDEVEGATHLLDELGVGGYQPEQTAADAEEAPPRKGPDPNAQGQACACRSEGKGPLPFGMFVLVGLAAWRFRRARR